jgi:hypothetical protein
MPAKCVSSVSPRFHYRRFAFCFLPLAAILEFPPSICISNMTVNFMGITWIIHKIWLPFTTSILQLTWLPQCLMELLPLLSSMQAIPGSAHNVTMPSSDSEWKPNPLLLPSKTTKSSVSLLLLSPLLVFIYHTGIYAILLRDESFLPQGVCTGCSHSLQVVVQMLPSWEGLLWPAYLKLHPILPTNPIKVAAVHITAWNSAWFMVGAWSFLANEYL